MADEWGPWVEHDGGPCPVPASSIVIPGYRGSHPGLMTGERRAGDLAWHHDEFAFSDIIRYRVRRPPAVRLLVNFVESLLVRERENA